MVLTAGLERYLAYVHRDGEQMIGIEVFRALHKASEPHPEVSTIYLGDSVARQIFMPGLESSPHDLYLACNAAITLAGQYWLLEQALDNCPNAKKVFLFLIPNAVRISPSGPISNDYFCEFFHSPGAVLDLWQVTHDRNLLKDHVLRMLIPHIFATNSWLSRSPEPVTFYKLLNLNQTRENVTKARSPISAVPLHYLEKIRQLCRSKGVELVILPCPCVTPAEDAALVKLYDAPIRLYDKNQFSDGVHFKPEYVWHSRKQVQADFERFGARTPRFPSARVNGESRRKADALH